jgi:hypothetical protein
MLWHGAKGETGATPQIGVKLHTDGRYYWTLNGQWLYDDDSGEKIPATGDKGATGDNGDNGATGDNGITPQLRINATTSYWEICTTGTCDNDAGWTPLDVKATGDKGEQGDAIFAKDGVDSSHDDYVEFTLADGTKIQVPKYRGLGVSFAPPAPFHEGESRAVAFTATGNPAAVNVTGLPPGWKVEVALEADRSGGTFTIRAPYAWTEFSCSGEAFVLVSDDADNTVMRPLSLRAAVAVTADGVPAGTQVAITATDGATDVQTVAPSGAILLDGMEGKTIKSIQFNSGPVILIGRRMSSGEHIAFRFEGSGDGINIKFREPVGGYIPIGSFAEFRLISTNEATLAGRYRLEADLDLLGKRSTDGPNDWSGENWGSIGGNFGFQGTFDGAGHEVHNLYINTNGNGYYGGGLFLHIYHGRIENLGVASGSVIGGGSIWYMGSVCETNYEGVITGCYNRATITGSGSARYVGGVCGNNSGGSITACYNTGAVTGASSSENVGGVCGRSSDGSIIGCYNTGMVTGNLNAGGVCGQSDGRPIIACYNTGAVTSNENAGGVYGMNYGSPIIACYNTGTVVAKWSAGGVCGGNNSGSITACYWYDVPGDDATTGIADGGNGEAFKFGAAAAPGEDGWPVNDADKSWGIGAGAAGAYWKSLGGWNGGNPVFPKLWWEQ